MAALTIDEVIEKVLNSDSEEEEEVENEDKKVKDDFEDNINSWLESFSAPEAFNRELFMDLAKEVLKPIMQQCSVSCSHGELQPSERSRAAQYLCTATLNASSILYSEALLWLKKIFTRLGGRVAFKQPYHGKTSRSIPYDVFKVTRRVVSENRDGSFWEPRCYIKHNHKAEIICFTTLYSFKKFMSVISGLSITDVQQYLCRKLSSKGREHHVVKLLVEEEKQLALTYWIKKGQLDITFEYGEWNTMNYPMHNCNFNPDSFL